MGVNLLDRNQLIQQSFAVANRVASRRIVILFLVGLQGRLRPSPFRRADLIWGSSKSGKFGNDSKTTASVHSVRPDWNHKAAELRKVGSNARLTVQPFQVLVFVAGSPPASGHPREEFAVNYPEGTCIAVSKTDITNCKDCESSSLSGGVLARQALRFVNEIEILVSDAGP